MMWEAPRASQDLLRLLHDLEGSERENTPEEAKIQGGDIHGEDAVNSDDKDR